MKLFRNPWIVGVLVIVALAMVGRQFLPAGRPGVPPAAPAPSVTGAPAVPAAPAPAAAAPVSTIDSNYAATHFTDWISSPRRDPFLLATPVVTNTLSLEGLKLKAIWRQTGSSLAVINQGVYAEGDTVEGYKVEKIEDNQVWLQGADQKQRLGFAADEPAATTNNLPAGTRP